MRRLALPLVAVLLVGAVLGVQVAAGGGGYVPLQPSRPCTQPPVGHIPPRLEPLAGEIVLLGLDNAACRLGISRERLILHLAETHTTNPATTAALKAGLVGAVDRLDREGRLPTVAQLLPDVVGQAHAPGILKTIVGAIPGGVVNNLLQTGPLLHQTIEQLNIDQVVHVLNNPAKLRSALQAAILQSALRQIVSRLSP